MVSDGYKYAIPLIVVAVFIGWLVGPWWALLPLLPATLLLWFFRDPERIIPGFPGAVVSPADGKVTDVSTVPAADSKGKRISIFLSLFDVHVNRSPIAGVIRDVRYRRGEFRNAMGGDCAERNEQNMVTVEGEGHIVVFKQIAGLLARRIVFNKQVGDGVLRGERVGMIKFGSRVDVLLDATATFAVKVGDHVKGGSSVLAYLQPRDAQVAEAGSAAIPNGAR